MFTVTKDGSVVAFKAATWNEAKTEATLEKSVGKLAAGDYSISVTGLTETALTGTSTVEAESVQSLELVGDNLVRASNGQTGTVGLVVKNQYGEDITKNILNADLTITSSKGATTTPAPVFSPTTGLITIDAAESSTNTFADQKIESLTVTVVHKATGKVVTKNLTVSAAATVGTFTIDQPELKSGATKLVQGTDYVLPVTAKDQYGTDIKFAQAANTNATGLTFVSSATEISNFQVNADGKVTFDIGAVAKTKEVTLTVVNTSTGDSKAVTFTIYAPAKAESATLTVPTEKFTTAFNGSSDALSYKIPVSLVDQYGTKLTDDQVVTAFGAGEFTIVSSNPSILRGTNAGASDAFVVTKDAKLGAVVLVEAVAKGDASVIFTVNGSAKTVTAPLKVVDPATPAAFAISPSATNVAVGGTSLVKSSFVDSDNAALTSAAATYKVNYSVAAGDASKVTISNNNQTIANQIATGTSIAINSPAAGTTVKVTATLYNDANTNNTVDASEAIDTKTFDIVVPAANASLSYEIVDIAKLYATGAGTLSSQYAKQIQITAKDANGATLTIPQNRIVGVTSSDSAIATVGIDGGVYKVVGNALPANTTTGTAELTVLVEDNDGTVKTVKKTVTVSNEALVPQSIKVVSDADEKVELTTFEITDSGTDGTSEDLATGLVVAGTGAASDNNFNFVVKDQFDGTSILPATFAVTGVKGFNLEDNETIEISNNGGALTLLITEGDTPGVDSTWSNTAEVTLTGATSNGLTDSIKITFEAASEIVGPVLTVDSSSDLTNLVLDVDEKLGYDDGAELKDHFTISRAGASITSATYDKDANTITFVIADADPAALADDDTISVKSTLEDAIGNKATAGAVAKVDTAAWVTN